MSASSRTFDWTHSQKSDLFSWCLLFTLGVVTTIYIDLINIGGIILRPVQTLPLLIGCVVVVFVPYSNTKGASKFFFLPLLLPVYLLFRHSHEELPGYLAIMRSVTNVGGYISALLLMRWLRPNGLGLWGIVCGCVLSCVLSAINIEIFDISPCMGSGRWQGLMPGANRFANICGFTVVLMYGMLHTKTGNKSKILYIALLLLSFVGLLMSGSRSATAIAVICCGACALAVSYKNRQCVVNTRVIVAIVASLVFFVVAFTFFKEHLPQRVVGFVLDSELAVEGIENDSRKVLFSIALDYFLRNPLIGSGVEAENFMITLEDGESHESSAHNTYLQLLSTSGVLGLFFFVLPLLVMLKTLFANIVRARLYPTVRFSKSAAESVVCLSLLLFFLLHAFTISLAVAMHVWIVFAAVANVCIASQQ